MTVNFNAGPAMADASHTSGVGLHLLVDFYDACHLDDLRLIEDALCLAARSCGATVLDVRLHSFGEGAGVTGVALLAESHISIHTWPECAYAAIDIFMCGKHDPRRALPSLRTAFLAASERVQEVRRGGELLLIVP